MHNGLLSDGYSCMLYILPLHTTTNYTSVIWTLYGYNSDLFQQKQDCSDEKQNQAIKKYFSHYNERFKYQGNGQIIAVLHMNQQNLISLWS